MFTYIVSAESLDLYRAEKPKIRRWVDDHNGKGHQWLLVFVPTGSQTMDMYRKIYRKIEDDFYIGRSGDRSVLLYVTSLLGDKSVTTSTMSPQQREYFVGYLTLISNFNGSISSPTIGQQCFTSYLELISKLMDGIASSFQKRR